MRTMLAAAWLLALSPPAFAEDMKATIQHANDRFVADFNKGDAAALAQLYTEHANALPPGAPMASGRAAIQQLWQGAISSGLKNISLEALDVQRYGNVAREIGRFGFDTPNGQRVEGKYVVVWKKAPGGWMLDTDIWNMNK